MAQSHPDPTALERVYVWEMPVRLTHWLIFFSILILSATGYYIGAPFIRVPGPAGSHFVMGAIRHIHSYTAIVFIGAVLFRIYWFFVGNPYARWGDYIPVSRRRFRSLWSATMFYTFLRREHDEYPGHNALAAGSYVLMFLFYILLILTGLVLHGVEEPRAAALAFFADWAPVFGGLQMARLIHHVLMWFVLIFAIAHIYFVFLSSVIDRVGTVDSIFSGFKYIPRRRLPR